MTANLEREITGGNLANAYQPQGHVVQDTKPSEYRLASKRDGTLVLQGAFAWECTDMFGTRRGIDWKDLPTVNVL